LELGVKINNRKELIKIENIQLFKGDCLEIMKDIPEGSVDMILCDLPYGTTKCKWDIIIPFEPLWEQYNRIIKDNGAIVLFGSQPFSSELIHSNIKNFKYEIIWDKVNISNPMLAKKQPLKSHENILVFYKKQPTYNPQMTEGKKWSRGGSGAKSSKHNSFEITLKRECIPDKTNLKYPKTIWKESNSNRMSRFHPTEKPINLLQNLIKTYTNEGDTILDNCMGSGSTGVACINTNRKFIGIEKDDTYFEIAENRILTHENQRKQEKNRA